MAKVKNSNLTIDDCKELIQEFFEKQTKFKKVQAQFNEFKTQFNSKMEDFFEHENLDKSITFAYNKPTNNKLVVNRIQKTSVEFNPDKLEKALGKKLSERIITKRYEITDMNALIAYLKECDVDPKIFKSFLSVSKSVDTQELDRLEELGKITTKQIKGCYTIKRQTPYFTVGVKKGQDDGETW